jgi:ABC-2 type transport system permease protein
MAYRSSFWMQIVTNFMIHFVEVVALLAMFYRFDDMDGWSLGDVAFLHGLSMIAFGVADTLAVGLDSVPEQIRQGEFDRVLTRPLSSWIQTAVSEVSLRHAGQIAQGAIVFAYALSMVEIAWTPERVLVLAMALLSGIGLYVALFTTVAILSFWTVNSIEVINAFTYGGSDLAQFPMHVYDRWLRNAFIFIIPVAFTSYFPSLFILGKPDPLGMPGWFRFAGIPIVALFCLVIAWAWRQGIRHYRSTGS